MFFSELFDNLKTKEIKTTAMQLLVWLAHLYYRLAYTHFCWSLRTWQSLESFKAKNSIRFP